LATVAAMKGSVWRVLVLACVGVFACVGVALAANSGSFFDPASDAQNAPDVTGVAVSNDDAGVVTVKVTLGNRQTLAVDDEVALGIDADQNPDTGTLFYGAEYEFDLDGSVPSVWQARPDGFYTQAVAPSSFHASFSAGVVTFSFKASEVGVSSGFSLYALGADRNWVDTAPDIRTVNYQLVSGAAAPPLSPDRRAPVDRALKSTGVHGKVTHLDYVALDGRGETAEAIVVYRGRKVLKRINFRLADTSPFLVYFAPWTVPKKVRGKLRFCVTSTDRAGNKATPSCAALTIK
jgi:hypothetical protein